MNDILLVSVRCWHRKSTREDKTVLPDWSTGKSAVSMT